jgi:DNA-binding NarL/FixJ family response regulator
MSAEKPMNDVGGTVVWLARLVVTEKAVSKHIGNIFTKLDLYPAEDGNRRVLAVLTYLNA